MFNKEVYTERRNKLRSKVSSGVILILGNQDAAFNYPANIYHFRQDSSFSYFFGLNHPNLAGVIDIEDNKDIIFGNDVDMDDIIWMGPQESIKDQASLVGVQNTDPMSKLADYLQNASASGRKIHFAVPFWSSEISAT